MGKKVFPAAGAASPRGGANACDIVLVLRTQPVRPVVHDAGRGNSFDSTPSATGWQGGVRDSPGDAPLSHGLGQSRQWEQSGAFQECVPKWKFGNENENNENNGSCVVRGMGYEARAHGVALDVTYRRPQRGVAATKPAARERKERKENLRFENKHREHWEFNHRLHRCHRLEHFKIGCTECYAPLCKGDRPSRN